MPDATLEEYKREVEILTYTVAWLAEELENRHLNEVQFGHAQIPGYSEEKWIELAYNAGVNNI